MIDIHGENVVTIAEAARHLPGRPHLSTVWRWITAGTRYGKLESVVIGGQRYTSIEALQRFAEASTAVADGTAVAPTRSKKREAEIAAAEAELDQLGV